MSVCQNFGRIWRSKEVICTTALLRFLVVVEVLGARNFNRREKLKIHLPWIVEANKKAFPVMTPHDIPSDKNFHSVNKHLHMLRACRLSSYGCTLVVKKFDRKTRYNSCNKGISAYLRQSIIQLQLEAKTPVLVPSSRLAPGATRCRVPSSWFANLHCRENL